jgi:hypothetical protein
MNGPQNRPTGRKPASVEVKRLAIALIGAACIGVAVIAAALSLLF